MGGYLPNSSLSKIIIFFIKLLQEFNIYITNMNDKCKKMYRRKFKKKCRKRHEKLKTINTFRNYVIIRKHEHMKRGGEYEKGENTL